MKNTQKIKGVIIQNDSAVEVRFNMSQVETNYFLIPSYDKMPSIASGATKVFDLSTYDCGDYTWLAKIDFPSNGNPWLTGNEQYMYNKGSHLYARYKYDGKVKLVYLGIETEFSKPKEDDTYYPTPMTFVEDDNDSDFGDANCGFIVGTNLTEAS